MRSEVTMTTIPFDVKSTLCLRSAKRIAASLARHFLRAQPCWLTVCFFVICDLSMVAQSPPANITDTPQPLFEALPLSAGSPTEDLRDVQVTRDGKFTLGLTRTHATVWNNETRQVVFAATTQDGDDAIASIVSVEGVCLIASFVESDDSDDPSTIEIRTLPGEEVTHTIQIRIDDEPEMFFNATGTRLGVIDSDYRNKRILVFDVATSQSLGAVVPFDDDFETACFVGDTTRVALGGKDKAGVTLKLWDFGSGKFVANSRWQKQTVVDVASSSDGKLIASVSNQDIKVFDISGDSFRTVGSFKLERGQRDDSRVFFSNNDRRIWSHNRDQLGAWDIDTREEVVREFSYDPDVRSMSVAGTDERVVLAVEDYSSPLMLTTRNFTAVPQSPIWKRNIFPKDDIERCMITRDGNVVCNERSYGPFHICDGAHGGQNAVIPKLNSRASISRQSLMYVADEKVRYVNLKTQRDTALLPLKDRTHLEYAAESLDGKLVFITKKNYQQTLKVASAKRKLLHNLPFNDDTPDDRCHLSVDGKYAALSDSSSCAIMDLDSDIELTRVRCRNVHGFSPDGRFLILNGGTGIFDVGSGNLDYPWPIYSGSLVQRAEETFILATLTGTRLRLWNYADRRLLGTIDTGMAEQPTSFSVSPDATRVAIGFKNGDLALWDTSELIETEAGTNVAAIAKQNMWPAIPRSFQPARGIEIIISADVEMTNAKIEQAIRDVLKKVREEDAASAN